MAIRWTRTALTTATAVLTGALLLTACGGGEQGEQDRIADARDDGGTGNEEPAEPDDEPAAPKDDGIERPEIVLPDDVVNIFEPVDTDDPVELAVLADNEHRIASMDEAITSGDLERPALGFYSTGEALKSAVGWIEPIVDSGSGFTGTTRYYNRSVSVRSDTEATVTYCVDAAQSYTTDRETGEVDRESAPDEPVFYITTLAKNGTGVWQTTRVATERGGNQCE
ncbi:hypothetical protein [Streptomyces aidingensis]|uniref:Lipoprotein n=1 Tax=Streptomyces aidingensis TaxID=910347 RepID=A0A1I1JQ73_9ACTN|nr:hypothetical protein [Streptomyces aidingensis]SFC48688.1 hypothetical protein SAMN05421773_103441 [Streptomyces aidingensis]